MFLFVILYIMLQSNCQNRGPLLAWS